MSQLLALVLVILILFVGEAVSIRTKAWIPSVFISAVLFLLGYWTFFPSDIVAVAGIPPAVATMLMYLLITNMGTLLSIRQLQQQWKTILISMAGIIGIIVFLFAIGTFIFDYQTMLVAIPPLVGGIVSALIMAGGAEELGLKSLAVFAIVIYVIQGFAGYPLTSIMLKKEGKRLLHQYRNGELPELQASPAQENQPDSNTAAQAPHELKMFRWLPPQYNTEFFKFLRLALAGYLAYLISTLLQPWVSVSPFVLCLLFGIIGASTGFLEKQALQKANGFGFAILGLMLFIFDGLSEATPQMMVQILPQLVATIILGVIGMYIFSLLIGKLLKVSKEMSFSISLTALYGFPADYIITNEVVKSLTTDEKEREMLSSRMLPPMLVGGFISVTIVSVILAGIFVEILRNTM